MFEYIWGTLDARSIAMANIGSLDRALRLVAGIGLLAVYLFFADPLAGLGGWRHAAPLVGSVMIGTALFRFCPAYRLFGIRTCATDRF
jgi:hypothetical protein